METVGLAVTNFFWLSRDHNGASLMMITLTYFDSQASPDIMAMVPRKGAINSPTGERTNIIYIYIL